MPTNPPATPMPPVFLGSWDPQKTSAFPVVPSNVTTGYYLVTGPGRVGGFDFGEGDWLLYLEEEGTAPNTGSWYRTSGGIIQLATTTQQALFKAADIADFNAAAHSAVLVDNTTIVKDPQTGALHVIAGPGSATPITNIIEEEDSTYVPPHGHVSTDTADFIAAVREALGPAAAGKPFFSNTALTNAVVFNYDSNLHAVSADVKIDNQTIVKNKYGQLVAGKPAPMNIGDIEGLQAYLNNFVSGFTDPTLAKLGAKPPTTAAWMPLGAHDFTGVMIGDAFQVLNIDISDIIRSIANLNASFAGVIPVAPPALNSSIIPVLDPQVTFFEAYLAGATTPTVIGVTTNTVPDTLATAPFFKGYAAAPAGTLTALIDNASAGQITPLDPGIDQTGAVAGALVITQDQDSYINEPAFHNLFKSIQARIVPKINLSSGHHTFQLQEVLPGTGTSKSGILTVDVDVPAIAMEIRSDTGLHPSPVPHFISGVPALDPSVLYTLSSLGGAGITAQGIVGYTYGKYILNITGKDTLIDHTGDVGAASIPAAPDYAHGHYGDAVAAPFTFHILDTYNERAALSVAPYNSQGTLGTPRIVPLGRVDATIETNRVFSGDPTSTNPSNFGATWDTTKSLVQIDYKGELQKLNHLYQWPKGNYTPANGPDYTAASGVQVLGQPGTWRWLTLKLAEGVKGFVAFTLRFVDGNVSTWTSDLYTCKTDGILIYAKLGTSGWVDCNSPYRGIGKADVDGAFAMDTRGHGYETTAIVKRVTLGPSAVNNELGNLYVRAAIPYGSTKQFSDIIVSDWA